MVTALAGATAGCQKREPSAATRDGRGVAAAGSAGSAAEGPRGSIDPLYRADIDAICNSVERADAQALGGEERKVTIAMWLGKTLKTTDARTFLVKLQPVVGNAKADALDAESTRVGLDHCPLAAVWREPGATSAP